MNRDKISKTTLIVIVLFISALFMAMIRHFLMALFLAGIFSAMAHPLYERLEKRFRGRRYPASAATIGLLLLLVILPLGGLIGIITAQAIKVGQSVTPWVQNAVSDPGALSKLQDTIPFYDRIEPYQGIIVQKSGELVGSISKYLINSLSSVTLGTVNFLFLMFVFLYTMFFFLMDGKRLLEKILYYLPLEDKDEQRMLYTFTSVTRATIKGVAVIGILQGGLAGFAFFIVGIPSAVFWGTIMTVLSIIPALGSALVWVPAAAILAIRGEYFRAAGLAMFCGLVVGSLDNVLRPRLVGKDTEMHDLLIFLGTLGGIAMFGIIGFIIGPILTALFVTAWEIYGVAFQNVLPNPPTGRITAAEKAEEGREAAG
ncbi:MAG: AI-2E family transporter [Desulfobacterales bacterium]